MFNLCLQIILNLITGFYSFFQIRSISRKRGTIDKKEYSWLLWLLVIGLTPLSIWGSIDNYQSKNKEADSLRKNFNNLSVKNDRLEKEIVNSHIDLSRTVSGSDVIPIISIALGTNPLLYILRNRDSIRLNCRGFYANYSELLGCKIPETDKLNISCATKGQKVFQFNYLAPNETVQILRLPMTNYDNLKYIFNININNKSYFVFSIIKLQNGQPLHYRKTYCYIDDNLTPIYNSTDLLGSIHWEKEFDLKIIGSGMIDN